MRWIAGAQVAMLGFMTMHFLAAGSTGQLKEVHQKIGKELIDIRREHPDLQGRIYSLLDEVGTMYRLSTQSDETNTKTKKLLGDEKKLTFSLKAENDRLKREVGALKSTVDRKSKLIAQTKDEITRLAEKEAARQEAHTEVAAKDHDGDESKLADVVEDHTTQDGEVEQS